MFLPSWFIFTWLLWSKELAATKQQDHSLARGSVNVQILTEFEYDNKRIFVYAARSNTDDNPRTWQFFYVPVLQPVQPSNSEWVRTEDNKVCFDLITGDDDIRTVAKTAIMRKFKEELTTNFSESWDITPLMIDSLVAYIVRATHTPVHGVLNFQLIHPNHLIIPFCFQSINATRAVQVKDALLKGGYKVEIAFYFDGFYTVDTNMFSITGGHLKEVLNSVSGDGTAQNVSYIHRSQGSKFIAHYLSRIQQVAYRETDAGNKTDSMSDIQQQFMNLFEQSKTEHHE